MVSTVQERFRCGKQNRFLSTHCLLPLATILSSALTSPSFAAEGSDLALEEIVVTAQKRDELLQDVPISIAIISGEKLDGAGIDNLQDLSAHLPSIHFTETGISTQVRVRGIGSDNSQGFEQSVGMYIDGVYYGRAQLFRIPMMDLEQAELLRGPQSILFGKNSIAGALNLRTAKPAKELTGHVALTQELEIGQTEVNGVVSIPLSDEFRARLAARKSDETGYVNNTLLDDEQPTKKETSLRLSMDWDASDKLHILAKGETHRFETRGRAIEILQDIPLNNGSPNYSQTLTGGFGVSPFDSQFNFERQTDFEESSDNEVNNMTFTTTYQIKENTLTWTAGILDFDYTERCDCDFTPAEILPLNLAEEYKQKSHEVRFASPLGQKLEWVLGLFTQTWDQTFNDQIDIRPSSIVANLSPQSAVFSNSALRRDFEQSSETMALFGQLSWRIFDKLYLTVGGRYTQEKKDATKVINAIDLNTNQVSEDPVLGYAFLTSFGAETDQANFSFDTGQPVPLLYSGHNVSGEREESAFTPLINLEYDISANAMIYGLYTTGFKAGGFDPRSNSVGAFATTDPNVVEENPHLFFEFEEETLTSTEIGIKTSFADGRGELNVAIYQMKYDDLQISQFDGGVGFNVGNANETEVRGLEIDGRWLISQYLSSAYSLSFLDFEYVDFKNGNCFAGQTPDGVDLDGDGSIDTCDFSGKSGVYTPEYTINLALDYTRPIFHNYEIVLQTDIQFVDSHQVHVNLSPSGEISPYTLLGMRLALRNNRWSAALIGRNLLNEKIVSYAANAPLSESLFQTDTHYGFVRPPRTVAIEARYQF